MNNQFMKEKHFSVFDISKANILLASTLGIVLNSCGGDNNNNEKTDSTPNESDKFKDLNAKLKELGLSREITDEGGLKDLAKTLEIKDPDKADENKVLEKLNEISKDKGNPKNKAILDSLKQSTPNPSDGKDDFSNDSLEDLLKKLSDDKNGEIDSSIKKIAKELLNKTKEIEDLKNDNDKKAKYDDILKSLKEKTGLVLKKESKADDITFVKQKLEALRELITPKSTGDKGVIKNVESIIAELFNKDNGPLKELNKDKVFENLFEFTVDEKDGKLSLYIEFKKINGNKKELILKDADCKKLFALDNKDATNITDSITSENIPKTTLYKILGQCISAISNIANISDDDLNIADAYSLTSDTNNEKLLDVDKAFNDVISQALKSFNSEIKENGLKVEDNFYQSLKNLYVSLCIKSIESLDTEDWFIHNEDSLVSEWLLKNIGIVKDSDNYVMFKNPSDPTKRITFNDSLKKETDSFCGKISIGKEKTSVKAVWTGLLKDLKGYKITIKGKNEGEIYGQIKKEYKNKNKQDEIFTLKKFDNQTWGVDLANKFNVDVSKDGAKFDKVGFFDTEGLQNSIILKILTKEHNNEILSRVNMYKCINGKDVISEAEYNALIDKVNTFLGLGIIDDLHEMIPYVKIKTQGSIIDSVGEYLKRFNIDDYTKVKNRICSCKIQDKNNADIPDSVFNLKKIIEDALSKVKVGGKVYVLKIMGKLNENLKVDTNMIKLDISATTPPTITDLLIKTQANREVTWLDILAFIFKGSSDIYDANSVKTDAFNGIFEADVVSSNVLKIDNSGSGADKNVKISTAGKVEIS